jgi:hypothetical protein
MYIFRSTRLSIVGTDICVGTPYTLENAGYIERVCIYCGSISFSSTKSHPYTTVGICCIYSIQVLDRGVYVLVRGES